MVMIQCLKFSLLIEEHFYDRKTSSGYIENRLLTVRKPLTPSKKKRSSTGNTKKAQKKGKFEKSSTDWKTKEPLSEVGLKKVVSFITMLVFVY